MFGKKLKSVIKIPPSVGKLAIIDTILRANKLVVEKYGYEPAYGLEETTTGSVTNAAAYCYLFEEVEKLKKEIEEMKK